ncbi:MAG: ABC transporter substrate-binding protein, partial [Planctomycetota bacterium]
MTRWLCTLLVCLAWGCGKAEKAEKVEADDLARGVPAVTDAPRGGTLVWGRSGDASHLDPAIVTDGESVMVVTNIFDTLVTFRKGTTEIIPWLAERWETSKDGLQWTFHLRKGVKFHDGSDLDAAAVVFSFERQKFANHPAHVGAFPYYADNFKALELVDALDDGQVRFTLSRPYAPFLAALALFSAAIVSPTAWKSEGTGKEGRYKYDFARGPVGTGPFVFKEWKEDERIVLEANPDHFMGRPPIDRLVFRPVKSAHARLKDLQAGGIQGMDNPDLVDIDSANADERLRVLSRPGLNVCYLAMNTLKAPFDDVRVRQAVAWVINKRRLIQAAYNGRGEPAVTMCPKTMVGHLALKDREPDAARARALLEEAGFPNGFETELWHGDVQRAYMLDPDGVAIQIQQDLKEIGIQARIRKMEWSAYIPATQRGEHPMCLLGWMADIGDPDNFLYVLLDRDNARPGSANNVSFYEGEKVHGLLLAAQRSYDARERVRLYHEAQRILFDEVPTVPLVTVPDFRILRREV